MTQNSPFQNPFFVDHLNPLFLETVNDYWNSLKNAQVSDEEKSQIEIALYNISRFVFRNLFKTIYFEHPLKVKGHVFLLSAIHSDGIGDFIATLKCACLLREYNPELEVHVVYTHKQELPLVDFSLYKLKPSNIHSFQETEDPATKILGNVLEEKPLVSFSEQLRKLQGERNELQKEYNFLKTDYPQAAEAIKDMMEDIDKPLQQFFYLEKKKKEAEGLYKQMQQSLAIINISLAINTFDNPLLASKSLYFSEAGNFQGIGNYLQKNWFSMGLGPFEEGIFVKKEVDQSKWTDTKISELLWKSREPTQENFKQYFKGHCLHLGYLPRIAEQRQVFIDQVCLHHIKNNCQIDIILPKGALDEEKYNQEWMNNYGISRIVVVEEISSKLKERVLLDSHLPNKKTLRLIYLLPTSSNDFIKLMALSDHVVGCTGDGSLGDCIALGKIPFYEVRPHKLENVRSFHRIARKLLLPDIMEYFEQLEQLYDWPAESFARKFENLFQEGTFRVQWNEAVSFVKKYYSFENSFIAHVNRHLFLTCFPELKEKEEFLIQGFFEKNISPQEAYLTMQQIIKNHQT